MSEQRSFVELMDRLRAGDKDAADQIFHEFTGRLIGLARHHLDRRLSQKLDADDIVQSVFKSFFVRYRQGEFELENRNSLWGLLVCITLRKCGRKKRNFYGPQRDVRKEAVLSPKDEGSGLEWEGVARDPLPEEAAVLAETVGQFLSGLTERERRIVELRLQGYTAPEISALVGRTEYTVQGILKRVRKRLRPLLQDEGT
jgi:RNA polymerase sigma-70 factor (ECF subfamily)